VSASVRLVGAAMAWVVALAWPALGQTGLGEPFELVRSLQSLQDQAVRGNTRAYANQRELLGRIAERFDAVDPERWKEPKNARAAVLFVLNGGNLRALQKVIERAKDNGLDEMLLKGVLAYGAGRKDEAAKMLGSVEARSLDASMAGHVAYVQGELVEKKEPAKALILFDDARLLAPGTIVEEAALRREIALLAAAGDGDRYEMLAAQYLRRFPNSIYGGGFRQKFAVAIAHNTSANDPDRLTRLASMLGGVGADERRDVYLTIAKAAIARGKVELARLAAANAVQLAKQDSVERERARLYEGAALIVTDDFDKGVENLRTVERSKLDETETVLLDAALSIASQIRRLPAGPEPDSPPPGEKGASSTGESQVVQRARKAIAKVDQILSEPGK
jgi:chemotaxis protein MotC